eukprot:g918.t1
MLFGVSWNGDIPLAKNVYFCGKRLQRYPWFMLSGLCGDVFQFVFYNILRKLFLAVGEGQKQLVSHNSVGPSTVVNIDSVVANLSFAIAYIATIAIRQQTHRIIVFGNFGGSYFENLLKVYASYLAVIFVSVVANSILVIAFSQIWAFFGASIPLRPDIAAYFVTTIFSGIASYQLLKKNWRPHKIDASKHVSETELPGV